MADRKKINDAIRKEEQLLAELRREVEERSRRLGDLHKQLDSITSDQGRDSYQTTQYLNGLSPSSNYEKTGLFRSLFKGREDVFPRRWENQKTGKSGYSPACSNEWEIGLCEKKKSQKGQRRTTCANCSYQSFLPVTDEVVANHLRGRHVIGIYPLLPDETCWFLAVDFDKKSWEEDVTAFSETCESHGASIAIERSRSGNGAHAWFFFASPVPAMAARKMACFIITETMTRRHQLSMESYDRLFPNQDTMPRGGFGNLIALPLQWEARSQGNSVFIDSSFEPYPDQWKFLAHFPRIDPDFIFKIVDEAANRGQVIGARTMENSEREVEPWNRPPSGEQPAFQITEPLPTSISAVLAQRLYIDKTRLPSPLINRIKRLAAFQNPEFYKKQRMRLSTALTPRVISCFEEFDEYVVLPRGCLPEVNSLLREYGISLTVDDKREYGKPLDYEFKGELTPIQEQAANEILRNDLGVFVAPPGTGKTVVGAYLIAARKRNALVLVHRKPILEQWIAQLSLFLGIKTKEIGQIGAGKRKLNGRLDVAMMQSLIKKGQVDDLVTEYGFVVVDECHHSPAMSFERVLSEIKARYIIGLTATPKRRDGHHPIISMQLGPIRFTIDQKSQMARRPFEHKLIVRETDFKLEHPNKTTGIQEIYGRLVVDKLRNDLIFDDVIQALEEKRSPILLTERRDHLKLFEQRLKKFTKNLIIFHGGLKQKARSEALNRLASIPEREERLILATGRYIGEGFDDSRLDTLFLALPVSWRGTLVQYTGRIHRLHNGKDEVRIYDYVDSNVPMLLKMFEKRLRGYRAIGYSQDETIQTQVEGNKEVVVVYDDEAFF